MSIDQGALEAVPVPTAQEVANLSGCDLVEVEQFYAGEVADQARRCRVATYTPALAAALVRRVQRAVAMSNLPLGVQIDEVGATRLGSTGPEVRRLEGPYRKVVVG
ncbi:hypothetical protein [Nocardioides bruguierae]|uniref:Uncharacterized protein n=1 Tax=Nocardioides bruguierae TaxID=2945102 RepID=A0A9X2ID89_9ACTN|nr:hypothetical protein [Nocardioides bruguierae]MCM0618773.1 hypothetical protein [Nocardioides bruguierae]